MVKNQKIGVNDCLWECYANSYFHFEQPWQEDNYAIITAWNPFSKKQSQQINCINNQKLELDIQGFVFGRVMVGDRSFAWYEKSYSVVMEKQQAIELGRKYKQHAIYYVEQASILYLVSCHMDKVQQKLGDITTRIV